MTTSRIVLCGGVQAPTGAQGEPLELNLHHHPNVNLKISDVSAAMGANLPDVLTDLLEVAAYVYCADQAVSRGGPRDTGKRYRRRYDFRIPVRVPSAWETEAVTAGLADTLNLLSDDEFSFTFSKLERPPPVQLYLEEMGSDFVADEVLLFSGGLDSLAGALEELSADGRRVALVTHRSAPKKSVQLQGLAAELRQRFSPERVRHIPVWVNKDQDLTADALQRTRSFLFSSLAVVVACMTGRSRVRFYENGVTSLNLPISAQLLSTRASRTTHPQVLQRFSQLFASLLGRPFEVENPFVWKTKTDVVRSISQRGFAHLVRQTSSCSRTMEATRKHTHCGRCSQCIDRRFAVRACDLPNEQDPAESYRVDLLTGAREAGQMRTMIESYVRTATEVGSMNDLQFFNRFGEVGRVLRHLRMPSDEAGTRVLDLQRRHAGEVCRVLDEGIRANATALREGTLEDSCIVVLAASSAYRGSTATAAPPTPTFVLEGEFFRVWFQNERAMLKNGVGLRHISRLLARPEEEIHCLDMAAWEAGDTPLPRPGTVDLLSDDQSVRAYGQRLRDCLAEIAEAERDNDPARLARLAPLRDALVAHLGSVTGLGDAPRPISDESEQARQRVTKAITRSEATIDKKHPSLARHFRKFLRARLFCSYAPEPLVVWTATG